MSYPPPAPPALPPPIPRSRRKTFVQLAQASWASLVIYIGISAVITFAVPHAGPAYRLVLPLVAGVMMLIGVVSAVIALCGVPRYGKEGILASALVGLILWVGLVAIAVPAFLHARNLALQPAASLAPPVHQPGATQLHDEQLGLTLDVPEGYENIPDTSKAPGCRYVYVKRGNNQVPRVFFVKEHPGPLARRHITQSELPAGSGATMTSYHWRGLTIDGTRVPESSPRGPYVTLNVLIPLKKQGVQLSFGGPAAAEPELRALADRVVQSIEGETNWAFGSPR